MGKLPNTEGECISIVGGELFNKGAQAMTFTVVDQMAKRYPEKDVYLLSREDYERDDAEKSQYNFEILPWGSEIHLSLLSQYSNITNTSSYSTRETESVRSVLKNSCMLIDINGFALSSQMGARTSFAYLTNIMIAKEFRIPMYILPQSIGPFSYSESVKLLLNPLLQTYLKYPDIVCPREKAGIKALAPYVQSNVRREFDIVLQTEQYDLDNVYVSEPDIKQKDIESDAVGIVPNSRVFERTNADSLYDLYESSIAELLDSGKSVYILRHSIEDLNLCEEIKDRVGDSNEVYLLKENLSAPELEHIIKQFEFLIGSRYHSIIHAYKHGVPAIAIGWAAKYEELLDEFGQSKYFYEGRNEIGVDDFVDTVNTMNERWKDESRIIQNKVDNIQQNDIFGSLCPQ
ncbi:polysaccharide pyruvyl transferase family protein [Haloferax gibbonsii]|uniref:polysaccharide pyruvyl transferase family protein n=1 Tax=Haloferax gibbonsii TaxID=35746 RepID=UPI0018CCE356|nr:polysaccharide pyruvyl transferase family protein [Haloferax gibbonsii]